MESRHRLRRVVSDPVADVARVALEVAAFHDRELDVELQLLRVDAIADVARTAAGGRALTRAADVVALLQDVLVDRLGFRGDDERPRRSGDAYLHVALDEHHGLPVTLAVLWVAVARRLGHQAYVVNLPGHVVAAVEDAAGPTVVDAFDGGRVLGDAELTDLVRRATGGRASFRRSMIRPATPTEVARRILANLTLDLTRERNPGAAIWTVVARLAMPDPDPRDHLVLANLLERSGRFVRAAQAYDRYLETVPDAVDADDVRARARRARSRTN